MVICNSSLRKLFEAQLDLNITCEHSSREACDVRKEIEIRTLKRVSFRRSSGPYPEVTGKDFTVLHFVHSIQLIPL
jgi:hypothetical protein